MINDSLKSILGDDLFNQVKTKIEGSEGKDKIRIENVDLESGNYIPKSKFNEINDQLKARDTQIATMNGQLEDIKKNNKGNDDLKATITELQTKNTQTETEWKTKLENMKKDHAIDEFLRDAKVRNPKAVRGLLDLEKVVYNDEKVVGLDEQIANLKKTEAYLFDNSQKPSGGFNPPAGGGDDKTPTQTMNDIIRSAF